MLARLKGWGQKVKESMTTASTTTVYVMGNKREFKYNDTTNPKTLKLMRSLKAISSPLDTRVTYILPARESLLPDEKFEVGICFYHYVLTKMVDTDISTLSAETGSVIEKVLLSSRDKPDTPVTPISDAELETITSEQIKTLSPDILKEVNKYDELKSSYGGGGKRKRVAAKPKATTAKPKPRPRVKATTKPKPKAKTAATKPRAKPKAKPKPKAVKK